MPARRSSDAETESVHTEYVGTFDTLRDEGEHFMHVAQYKRAIDSFTKALDFKEEDKQCLVTRSVCYLQLGDAQSSLADAEAALQQDPKFIRKAQALYQLGDFESALIYYHRGHKVRPELEEFRLGIQKSQEAIANSIGTPVSVKLKETDDIDLTEFYREQERNKKVTNKGGYQKPQAKLRETRQDRSTKCKPDSEKATKQLLGNLYGDRVFLESLLTDDTVTGQNTETSIEVKRLVLDCLDYLDTRTDFWRQQKPLYARKRDRELRLRGPGAGKTKEPTKYIIKQLEAIDEAQADGRYEESLKQAKNTTKTVESWSKEEISNKEEILANLHSLMGNAYLEMGNSSMALHHHEKDLEISEANDLADAKSRALDNLGRVYARQGSYQTAVDIWRQKLLMEKTALESAWLFHEIGRCYLELKNYEEAKDFGDKSLDAAKEADDLNWQLHAAVLIAQSEVKLDDLHSALDSFERAQDIAQTCGDDQAQQAIKNAIAEVNRKIIQGTENGAHDQPSESADDTKGDHLQGDTKEEEYKDDFDSPKSKDSDSSKHPKDSSRSSDSEKDKADDKKDAKIDDKTDDNKDATTDDENKQEEITT